MAQKRKQPERKMRIEDCSLKMQEHIRQLGISSVEGYKEWCRTHNFSQGLDKNPRQRRDELYVLSRTRATRIMAKREERPQLEGTSPKNIQPRTTVRKITECGYQSHFGSF